MFLNFKNIFFLILIILGCTIFYANSFFLELINIKSSNIKKLDNIVHAISSSNEKLIEKKIVNINKDKKLNTFKETIIEVKKGQTFIEILTQFNLDNKFKFQLIKKINEKFNLKNLKINQKIIFYTEPNTELAKIKITLNYNSELIISIKPEIIVTKQKLKTSSILESKEYVIFNSLYADGIKNNLPNEILNKLIQLFSFDLDFQRDIKKNTLVSVSYEKIVVENTSDFIFGDIDYAKIKINNNYLEYFKFLTDEGYIDYFTLEGKNVKKSLLKTPLDGAKISSNYGMRKHPISGFNKMHKGVDFAAPKGTPIYAGGNGIIELANINGGYGKYIRIRHNNGYKTAYAHLNNFKKGISKGVRVNQGDVIGYVGNTGNSTGPHLHYEIIYKGKHINPMELKLPSGKILEGLELKRFQKNSKVILSNHLYNLFE